METFQPVLSLFSAFLAVVAKFKHRNFQSFDHEPETKIFNGCELPLVSEILDLVSTKDFGMT